MKVPRASFSVAAALLFLGMTSNLVGDETYIVPAPDFFRDRFLPDGQPDVAAPQIEASIQMKENGQIVQTLGWAATDGWYGIPIGEKADGQVETNPVRFRARGWDMDTRCPGQPLATSVDDRPLQANWTFRSGSNPATGTTLTQTTWQGDPPEISVTYTSTGIHRGNVTDGAVRADLNDSPEPNPPDTADDDDACPDHMGERAHVLFDMVVYKIAITEKTPVFAPRLSDPPTTCQVSYEMEPHEFTNDEEAGHEWGSVALQVYKMEGSNLVLVFAGTYSMNSISETIGYQYRLRWDGKKNNGEWADPGKYRFKIKQFTPNGAWSTAWSDANYPMYLVNVGATEMDFVDYDSGNEEYKAYPLKFNEKSETDTTDVDIDTEWKVPDVFTSEAPPSSVYTSDSTKYNWPVCYMKQRKMRVMVKTDGAGYGTGTGCPAIRITADYSDPVPGGGDENNIAPGSTYGLQTASANTLPTSVGKYASFSIPIKFHYWHNEQWYELGTQSTTHVFYLVNDVPGAWAYGQFPTTGGRIFVAVVDVSCTRYQNAEEPDSIFDGIWQQFWELTMPTPAGQKDLVYQHYTGDTAQPSVTRMLDADLASDPPARYGKHWGTCRAWTRFLCSILEVQGLDSASLGIRPLGSLEYPQGILHSYSLLKTKQMPGQHNPTPRREFPNHAVSKYDNQLFDPSYRKPTSSGGYSSLKDYEDAAIESYYCIVDGQWEPNMTEPDAPSEMEVYATETEPPPP